MNSKKIKEYAKEKKVFLWEIAKELNVSEPTITRKFRFDIDDQEAQRIFSIINKIHKQKEK